ncbi:MAG TPA: hypothetical protein VLN56_09620 [Gammaproteobacteria bacterium]|nr:hypothetical protein [Gammaproteobacteria bacterium]
MRHSLPASRLAAPIVHGQCGEVHVIAVVAARNFEIGSPGSSKRIQAREKYFDSPVP